MRINTKSAEEKKRTIQNFRIILRANIRTKLLRKLKQNYVIGTRARKASSRFVVIATN